MESMSQAPQPYLLSYNDIDAHCCKASARAMPFCMAAP